MDSVYDLLKEIKNLGARIYAVDDQIKLDIKKGGLTREISEKIKYYRNDILALIKDNSKPFEFSQIENVAQQASYPVSDGQRRLWILSQFGETSVAYNMPEQIFIDQNIEIENFKKAVAATVERHEILRTVFKEDENGELRQWILKKEEVNIEPVYKDFREAANKQELAQTYIKEDSNKAFDLANGPLLRVSLLQLEDAGYVLYYNMHHIISDGWSMEVLRKDFFTYYEACQKKQAPHLKELRIQYKDYSAWQLAQVKEQAFNVHKAYWLDTLKGELPLLDLPGAKQRPAVKSIKGHGLNTYIDSTTSAKLKAYSEEKGGSLFMGLLTAWNVLMYRYTGQQDIITGIPVAGREHADLTDQIGFYINTLALRNTLNPAESFSDLFSRVKQNTLTAYNHQVYPFDRLVEELNLIRDTSRSVVFDALITYQNTAQKAQAADPSFVASMHETEDEIRDLGSCTSKFDVSITFQEVGNQVSFGLVYNPDVYEFTMMKGLMRHYKQLLIAILANPEEKLARIDYLSGEEKQELLWSFNDTQTNVASGRTVIDLFEAQVATNPHNTAVQFGEKKLSYKELNERANQLAHYLQKNYAVKANDLVGILQDRSEWMIISILGVLKSGAAYVPVDPTYPAARKSFILEDTEIRVLLTQTDYIFDMDYYSGSLFAIDAQMEELITLPSDAFSSIQETALAYVIYTSGSTGKPKGCGITHANLAHYVQWANEYYFDKTDQANFCLYTSLSFDLTVTSIYCALTQGGSLKIYASHSETAEILKDAFNEGSGITSIKLTPSHISLLQHLDLKTTRIERAIVGGEAVNAQHVKILKSLNPAIKVYNEYGPTETTVGCIVKELQAEEAVYIGKPMKGVQVYILGAMQELVPIGVPGEICISGQGVGEGYLNRPDLTAEKFIPNPFVAGERMYRTGDTGRWLVTGEMEYLGRTDEQVKIRGYRIELGEIENCLLEHPSISEAVVLAQSNSNAEQELVAYLVAKETVDITDLKMYLNKQLPAYQVPAHYVQVEAIPLTVNAKVDRKQLQAFYSGTASRATAYVAPRNDTEEKLVDIWQEILGKENIGIRDNFFDLGGDSIKILRMMAMMRRELSIDTPIVDVYKYNTIESLHEYVFAHKEELESRSRAEKEAEANVRAGLELLKERSMSTLQASGKDLENIADIYPMSDIEKGMIFESIIDADKGIYHDQKVFQRSFAEFDTACFERALNLMTEKHDILRSSFHLESFETEMKIVERKISLPYEYMDLRGHERSEQEEAVKAYMRKELARPFVIDQAPLWRMTAFNFGANEIVFVFQCHHAIIDGWSETSFVAELNNIYLQLRENSAYRPALLQSTYKDFIIEHELIRTNESIRNFWKEELADAAKSDLFTSEQLFEEYGGALDEQVYKQIKNLAHKNNISIKVISLSAYMLLLRLLNYDQDMLSGLVTNMRPNCEDSDQILGCFLNTIPFRMEVDGTKTGVGLMNEIHEKLLNLKDKEKLSVLEMAALFGKGSASGNPFFDVLFNYVDFHVLDSVKDEERETGDEPEHAAVNIDGQVVGNTFLDFSVDITGGLYRVHISLTRKLKAKLTAEKIAALYFAILRQLIQNPNVSLAKLSFVTGEEQQQLLHAFNDTAVAYPDTTILHLFEQQAKTRKESSAVIFNDTAITYAELHERSNQLAHYLRDEKGVKADDLVGIELPRNEWAIIVMLGILKSGAAYVPIDPSYPEARIAYMRKDSNCKMVVDEAALTEYKKQQHRYAKNDLAIINSMNDLAYVIYTSGSTGEPKGVMITHRSLADYAHTFALTFHITEKDRCIQQSSFSFDTHVEEIYPVLCKGGTLLIAGNGGSDIQELQQLIQQQKATVLSATPIVLAELNALKPDISSLRLLISGGDTFNASAVDHFLGKLQVYDSYGPSESTVCCTYHEVRDTHTPVVIGRPISNRNIYILSKENQLAPVGIVAEICIAGAGLAKGYLNKPGLTALKFVENPFKPGTLMYRSGDLGRWLPDGNIEFMGRMDEQIKIRGYRIEKGEIENELQQHPAITAAVVSIVNSGAEKQLVAYYVAGQALNSDELRNYLKRSLPVYMIPAHFVQLKQIPMTTNGKVDKKALPDPETLGLSDETEYIAPRNKTEEQLVEIWKEVLQKDKIGVTTDFFTLGGHSLKAVRLKNQYQKMVSVNFSLKDLFEHTTIASHAALIQATNRSEYVQVEKVAPQKSYPISDGQRRLWVLCQFEQSSVAYNMPASIVLEKDVDVEILKNAINRTIERHEILRTVFRENETGEIRQWVVDSADFGFKIDYKDFRKLKNKDAAVQRYISKDSATAFDLEKGPLLRAGLLHVAKDHYVFYFNMHHIISDGWSIEVLSRNVFSFYDAIRNNKDVSLKELRIQYKDYSAWALAQLNDASFKAHREYWLTNLSGSLPLLELPATKQRPAIKTYNGRALSTYIDKATSTKLKKYSEANGGTLFMGLLASWNVLMYNYTGQKDIIIGTPVAGRDHADLEDQIGFYVNTLALRNELLPEESFDSFYKRLKDNTLKSYSHQMYPFDRLIEELDLQRDTSRSAVFDIMFILQNTGEKREGVDEAAASSNNIVEAPGYHTSKFDIDISVQELGDYLSFSMVYNPDVYEWEMVEGLIRHYKRLLNSVVENPAQRISAIDYLSLEEKQKLLIQFNDNAVLYPKNKTIIDLVEAQVRKTPHKTAVVFEDKELTYQQLDEQSNQFAHYLQKHYAIGADDFVGIKQERTAWMIISVLAVLKAGAAYVPIDLAYPQERIDYIEKDTNCKACIDAEELNKFQKEQQQHSKEKVSTATRVDDLAYVIYTSGSTGRPKGVLIEHKNAYAFIKWCHDEFKRSEVDTVLFTTSLNFDLSVFEIFYTLSTGKELNVLKDGLSIPKYLDKNKKQLINTVPSVVGFLLQQEMSFDAVSVLNMAGEPIPANYRAALKGKVKEIRNLYGPSEDTTYSTFIRIDRDERELIGKPISNTQVYILSDADQLIPIGVVGEICISGEGLARGYLNQEELTKAKFVNHPFKQGERLYKTGDLGRWLPDGNIDFLGRKDNQVKIRGYRIELGEIENTLQGHPDIDAAVVLARENQNKEKELVAYITSESEQTAAALRAYLKETLPEYMLPTHFVQLDKLPLTSNGKVDKKSLPAPEGLGLASGVAFTAPRNATEEQLVKIWEDVLQREHIGIQDDFFALGGHSLRVIRLRNQYQNKLSVNFSLKDLFTHTSIASHAALIAASEGKAERADRSVMNKPETRQIPHSLMHLLSGKKINKAKNIYFIPPVAGTSILYKPLVDQLDKAFNCYGFQYTGMEKGESLFESILQAAEVFANEIVQQETNKELVIVAYSMGASIAFEMVKLLEKRKLQVQLLLLDATVKAGSKRQSTALFNKEASVLIEAYKKLISEEHLDEDTLRKFLVNNFTIHEAYKPAGKISSDILLFEASNNALPTDMKKWKKYTEGTISHSYVEGGHWDMLSPDKLPVYASAIIGHFADGAEPSEQMKYTEQFID